MTANYCNLKFYNRWIWLYSINTVYNQWNVKEHSFISEQCSFFTYEISTSWPTHLVLIRMYILLLGWKLIIVPIIRIDKICRSQNDYINDNLCSDFNSNYAIHSVVWIVCVPVRIIHLKIIFAIHLHK